MKCAKFIEEKIEIVNVERPVFEGSGAIIKVIGCGLCGSDLVKIKHKAKNIILGHEVVGEIVEIGENETFKKGDIVACGHHYPCFNCNYCKNQSYSMCKTFKNSNIYPAGFSEYIKVDDNHLKYTVYKMNLDLEYDEMAFLEPLSCCIRAIRRAGFKYEEDNSKHSALVLGLGSVGLLMMKGLKAYGVDVSGFDINPKRQEFARLQGFDYKDKKYDVVFLCAGHSATLETALKMVQDGGKIIVFASIEDDFKGFSNNEIYYRELSIIASYSPAPCDIKQSSEFINSKKVDVKGLSTHYSLDNLALAVEDSLNGKTFKAFIQI
ncbi:alcohol dehydrogenase catalytic domain-containing protein [bacterium]|nr:alcohol dehydrogenase catalytic domain-containing protein [bacterium]